MEFFVECYMVRFSAVSISKTLCREWLLTNLGVKVENVVGNLIGYFLFGLVWRNSRFEQTGLITDLYIKDF